MSVFVGVIPILSRQVSRVIDFFTDQIDTSYCSMLFVNEYEFI